MLTTCATWWARSSPCRTRSNARRGFAVEDTAAAEPTFASGAIATVIVPDAVPSPSSWELTAGEVSS